MHRRTSSPRRRWLLAATAFATATTLLAAPPALAGQGFYDDDDSVFEADIEAIADKGITAGCNPPDNSFFCPDNVVTRGAMAAFLVRALDLTDPGTTNFVDDNGHVFEADIEKLAAAGITKGCNPPKNDKFCPDSVVTRGSMAAFLVRALNLSDDGGGDLFGDDNDSIFEADIDKLATAGITKGCNPPANDEFCPTSAVTRGAMAAFLARALDLPLTAPAFSSTAEDHALVSRYHVLDHEDGDEIDIDDAQYSPRSFAVGFDVEPDHYDIEKVDSTGRYAGWDVLSPSTRWKYKNLAKKDDWFHFVLNRDATVGVVWRDDTPTPSWLSGWTEGGTVVIDGDLVTVWEKSFSAGEVVLGSVEYAGEWRKMYLVLLAEADGEPSPRPPAPAGFTPAKPNRPCPTWVHDMHTTVGPDGKKYATWHPQADPTYWCYFAHDHGSDPSLIPGSPQVAYGYVAAKLGQDEPNPGFKEYTFQDMDGEHWVRFVVHVDSSSHRRVCARFHTLHIEVYDLAGALRFSAAFKADYGVAEATSDSGGGLLTPTNCGYSMGDVAEEVGNRQSRRINVGADADNYEKWDLRENTAATLNLGITSMEHNFDIINPMSHCVDTTCNSVAVRSDIDDENAMRRRIQMASWSGDFVFDAEHGFGPGTYYTDPYATKTVGAGAANAVEQYKAPGFTLEFAKNATAERIECVAFDPWTMEFECMQVGGAGNIDHSPFPQDHRIETAIFRH